MTPRCGSRSTPPAAPSHHPPPTPSAGPLHWEDHGETITVNLICLCAHHHRQHHQGLLGITGNADEPDGVAFTNGSGLVLGPAGRPIWPQPDAMPTVDPYDGPTGETLHKHWVSFTRRPAA